MFNAQTPADGRNDPHPGSLLDDFGGMVLASDIIERPTSFDRGHRDGPNALFGDLHVSWIPIGRFRDRLDRIPDGSQSVSYNPKVNALDAAMAAADLE